MKLGELIDELPGEGTTESPAEIEIGDLAYDARRVSPGSLFFCVPGFTSDGHDFAAEAIERGTVALVVERPLGLGVPEVLVPSARSAMAPVAARFFGDPTSRLAVVGVTGTNGKTTTAFLVRSLLEAAGRRCALMGTIRSVIGGEQREVKRTTPEAIDLQRAFAEMLSAGDEACAIEVSSHALELGRADAVNFAVSIFTNLTQDHLDFHPTMEDYFLAKRRLFDGRAPAIVNVDDPYGRRLASELGGAVTFAIDSVADYRAREVRPDAAGCEFVIDCPDGSLEVRSPLPGRFNVSNVLAAFAAVRTLGVPAAQLVAALPSSEPVPGRFEPVDEGQPFAVLVDYAHTPDSLENVLRAARELTAGRLLCVFGCGGDRDRGKRPMMGAVAAELADIAIVTSDNPRSEQPQAIIAEILQGIPTENAGRVEDHLDRREAIARAIGLARPGDVVVIAGKGHEQGQEFEQGRTTDFDDRDEARAALRGAATAAGGGA